MKTLVLFNNKGGVGKTSLVYHLAWMFTNYGIRVVAVDLDPQANLTAMFLDEDRLEGLWPDGEHPQTVFGAVAPLIEGTGDIRSPHVEAVSDDLGLVVGDLVLSRFEDDLSSQWPDCLEGRPRAFRVISAFYRVTRLAAESFGAQLALIDVGPNLGAINRAALIAAEHVLIPLTPDLFSLQGLKNLGPTLRKWRRDWEERLGRNPEPSLDLPTPGMEPCGYVIQQHSLRLDRPVMAYARWMALIPQAYREAVQDRAEQGCLPSPGSDENCLATLKHYRSLMPMAMEARKPVFHLRPADGAIGSHANAVQDAYQDFRRLAATIGGRCQLDPPSDWTGETAAWWRAAAY